MTHDTNQPQRLNPWNPLDHLRLLWWVLVTPQRLLAYREAYGENDERRVGKWLASTLTWLPPFVLTLAIGLGEPPCQRDIPSSIVCLWISPGLILAWVLTGWLRERWMVVTFLVAFAVVFALVFFVVGNMVAGVLLSVTGAAAFVVAYVVADTVVRVVAAGLGGLALHSVQCVLECSPWR